MELELRHLRVVRAVASTGSLTKAAASLAMSQPALTAQLQRIERILGGTLFDRGRSGARPTALGELVLSHADAMLPLFDAMERGVQRQRADSSPSLVRVGAVPSSFAARVPSVVADVLDGTDVDLRTGWSATRFLDLLATGFLELVLLAETADDPLALPSGVASALLAVEPLFIAVSARHRLAERTEVDLAELTGERWLLVGSGNDPGFDQYLRTTTRAAGIEIGEITELDSGVALQMVALGDGVLPVLASSVPRAGVVALPLRGDPMSVTHRMVWRAGGSLAASMHELHARMVAAGVDAVRDAPAYAAWSARRATRAVDPFENVMHPQD